MHRLLGTQAFDIQLAPESAASSLERAAACPSILQTILAIEDQISPGIARTASTISGTAAVTSFN